METIDILLATYNGAPFIRTQIHSILSQTYPHWCLLIHDDGSTDETLRIIKEMAASDTRIRLIEDEVKELGPGGNFMHLLRHSKAPFICFCDQDDLWFENKLSASLEAIKRQDNTRPQVIVTNSYLWYSSEDNSIKKKTILHEYVKMKDVLFRNGGMQGAAMILNAAMREYVNKPYAHIAMHDHIITLAGIATDGIKFLDVSLYLYRQHTHNYSGRIPVSFSEKIVKTLMRNRNLSVVLKTYYEGIKAFYEIHGDSMSAKDRRYFDLFLSYPSLGRIKRFVSILKNGFRLHNSSIQLLLKLTLRRYM